MVLAVCTCDWVEGSRLESGKRKAESGKRKAESGKRKAESGKRKAESGKRKAESGKRKAESGKRKAESGKRKAEFPLVNSSNWVCRRPSPAHRSRSVRSTTAGTNPASPADRHRRCRLGRPPRTDSA